MRKKQFKIKIMKIKNQVYKIKNDFMEPYNLIIEGGEGHGNKRLGGTYNFVGTYLNPRQTEGRNQTSLNIWCDDNELHYVTANTFEELLPKLVDLSVDLSKALNGYPEHKL